MLWRATPRRRAARYSLILINLHVPGPAWPDPFIPSDTLRMNALRPNPGGSSRQCSAGRQSSTGEGAQTRRARRMTTIRDLMQISGGPLPPPLPVAILCGSLHCTRARFQAQLCAVETRMEERMLSGPVVYYIFVTVQVHT